MKREVSVRVCVGEYAYEVTEVTREFDSERVAAVHWSFTVYRVAPNEEPVAHGENSPNREHAERNARQLIGLYRELDREKPNERSSHARR